MEVSTGPVITDRPEKAGGDSTPLAARSTCEPYREFIEASLAKGRNAMAIWQDLVDDHGFAHRYASVKRFVRGLRASPRSDAHPVITTAPGEEGQVDYGGGPMVRDPNSGRYRRTRQFVFTLAWSRKSVRLLTFGSSSRIWAELHEKAFARLGGAPRTVVLDNLREGVLAPDIYDPALNPVYRDALAHYSVTPMPCRVRDPNRKACVSYCTSSRLRNGENWLPGASASLALANRVSVQRFVETAPGIVVAVLSQPALSCPKIDCSGRHAMPHAHFPGCE
jgi:transposase